VAATRPATAPRATKKGLKQIEAQLREETRLMVLLRYRILIN